MLAMRIWIDKDFWGGLQQRLSLILKQDFSMFAPPARSKSKEKKDHVEMPKVWPVDNEV